MIDLSNLSVDEFVNGIRKNDKVILSRTITLLESRSSANQEKAYQILERCMPFTGHSIRIGITGPPGAGKSTFIESFGKIILTAGKKLAVVAIDPSSRKNKGSILGDKTRMQELSKLEHVFIRPSASGEALGGVTSKTREVILILEAAGYDTILVETVGVGQNETAVYHLVDFFLLLMMAGAGDELQGIKRGIMEMADLIAINKSDGDNIERVKIAKAELSRAQQLFPAHESGFETSVLACSAITGNGIDAIWQQVLQYQMATKQSGYFDDKRKQQLKSWLNEILFSELILRLSDEPKFKSKFRDLELDIDNHGTLPVIAVRNLVKTFLP